jgi:hypothetical protein
MAICIGVGALSYVLLVKRFAD